MISYIKGILAAKLDTGVIVETAGIGYEINVPSNSPFYLHDEGDEVICYTYMAVREDDVSLYGFSDRQTLKMFKLLLTVNGIGAKAAISVLSVLDSVKLAEAVALSDDAAICKAQGIGKKSAQRIVLELKDKIGTVDLSQVQVADRERTDIETDAVNALVSLGYTKAEALSALSGIEADSVEGYIKKALKNLF